MSTLNVSNITDGTTTVGTSYVVNGSAKAWINFNGTGTIATRDSLNVSSISDDGAGITTITYANSMANDDYANGGMARELSGGAFAVIRYSNTFTTSQTKVASANSSGSNIDCETCAVLTNGDLA